eukprot:2747759-Rhodomonas_salina.1
MYRQTESSLLRRRSNRGCAAVHRASDHCPVYRWGKHASIISVMDSKTGILMGQPAVVFSPTINVCVCPPLLAVQASMMLLRQKFRDSVEFFTRSRAAA